MTQDKAGQFGVLKSNPDKILYSFDRLKLGGIDGIMSRDLIKFINSEDFLQVIGSTKEISEGSIYGTLSRLRSKGYVKKLLKQNGQTDELIYKITGKGQRHLNNVLAGAKQQLINIDSFVPDFSPAPVLQNAS